MQSKDDMKFQLKELEQLRRTFNYELALQKINENILKIKCFDRQELLLVIELIRLLILTSNHELAIKYFRLLEKFPKDMRAIGEEIIMRLSIAKPAFEKSQLSISVKHTHYKWVRKYQEENDDVVFQPLIQQCEIINSSCSNYIFTSICDSCGGRYSISVIGTLLIYKEYLCPICLAKQLLTFETIKTYIFNNYPELVGESIKAYDLKIIYLSKNVNAPYNDEAIPRLARYLSQDTIFTLNQLIITKLTSPT